jgi:hypothetical protein
MKSFLWAFALVSVIAMGSEDSTCSDPTGTVSYSVKYYRGGAAPPRNSSLKTEIWKIRGTEITVSIILEERPKVEPVAVDWNETGIYAGPTKTTATEKITQDIRRAHVVNENGDVLFSDFLFCRNSSYTGPPRP